MTTTTITIEAAVKATRYYRNTRGWCGETTIALPGHEKKELVLNTHKHSYSPVLTTDASVHTDEGEGRRSFIIGAADVGDYSKRVILTSPKRVTEKSVQRQHETALLMLDDIVHEAVAYYDAQKQRKAERQEVQQVLPFAEGAVNDLGQAALAA